VLENTYTHEASAHTRARTRRKLATRKLRILRPRVRITNDADRHGRVMTTVGTCSNDIPSNIWNNPAFIIAQTAFNGCCSEAR